MDKKAARNLWTLIEQDLPEYRLRNRLLAQIPIGSFLCGVLFEPSAFSKVPFYINIFVQPLYVPSKYLTLTFGMRISGEWDYEESKIQPLAARVLRAIQEHARPFFQQFRTPELFYRNAPAKFSPTNIHLQQSLVLTAIHLGQNKAAQKNFESLRSLVDKTDPRIPWPHAVLQETQLLLDESVKGLPAARRHLQEIELETLRNLKLDNLPFKSDLLERNGAS